MHLTNYAINKNSDDFVFNEEESVDDVGHKRSLSAVLKQLEDEGNDPNQIMNKISDLVIKTIATCQPSIAHAYRTLQPDDFENSMIFELLGFDILLDYKCRPWLLEVNSSPSFTTDTPLDRKIKKNLISDTFKLLNLNEGKYFDFLINSDRKHLYKKVQQDSLMARMRTGKQVKLTQEEKIALKIEKEELREKYEAQNMGKYILLYPLSNNLKEKLKAQSQTKVESGKDIDEVPDQQILQEAQVEPRKVRKVSSVQTPESQTKTKGKKKAKESDDDGDIYLKYLKKAATIWEDFTTGKKKPKEESDAAGKKSAMKKAKSINPKIKATEGQPQKVKPAVSKTNSAAVTHSNSIKKKVKKTLINMENEKEEPRRIIITTKTHSVEDPKSTKHISDVDNDKCKVLFV